MATQKATASTFVPTAKEKADALKVVAELLAQKQTHRDVEAGCGSRYRIWSDGRIEAL